MFPYYLSEHVWEKVLDQKLDRGHCLDVLLSYVGHLGLRRPTELTISVLVTLVVQGQNGQHEQKGSASVAAVEESNCEESFCCYAGSFGRLGVSSTATG